MSCRKLFGVSFLAPILGGLLLALNVGGCPDVRTGVLDAFQSSTLAYVSENTTSGAQGVLERGLIGTFVRVFFERLSDPATP